MRVKKSQERGNKPYGLTVTAATLASIGCTCLACEIKHPLAAVVSWYVAAAVVLLSLSLITFGYLKPALSPRRELKLPLGVVLVCAFYLAYTCLRRGCFVGDPPPAP